MKKQKKELLNNTFNSFIEVGLSGENLEILEDIVFKDVVGFGTTVDEKLFGVKELRDLLIRQKEQSAGMALSWNINTLDLYISSDENTAIFTNEITLYLIVDDKPIEIYLRFSIVMEYADDKWMVVHWHGSKPEQVESEKDTWGVQTWKEKAEELENLVAERTADLVVKNRELEIETALERIRSRSMAMHKSDELKEIILVVYDQLVQLQVKVEHAGFIIDYTEHEDMHIWLADRNSVFPKIVLPYFDCAHWNDFIEAKKTGQNFFTNQLGFEEKNKFYNDLFQFIPNLPDNTKATYFEFEGLAISTVLLDNVGLYIENYSGTPFSDEENAILMRFGKVFQQAYTRFLDLQKAEAQAKEAQIEAALERVRSRSLAMHHSSELSAVVDTLLGEFTNLEFTLTFCIINLIDEQDMSNTVWAANPETGKDPESYYMKFEDYPFHHAMWDAWKAQKKRFVYTLEGEEKKLYDEYLYNDTQFRRFPKNVQEANKALERYVAGFTFYKYSGLQTVSVNPISEDELEILERFGRVFEQAYTRFLDLQKAEAQAREAQIEAALEKVRSRSMAMHNSQELKEVALELRKQMGLLGQKDLEVCAIHLYGNDEDSFESWSAMKASGSETEIVQTQAHFPKKGIRIVDEMMHHYTIRTKDYVLINEGEKIAEWFKVLKKHAPELHTSILDSIGKVPEKQLKANWAVADFSGGALVMVTYGEPDELSRNLLRRSANVFEQAYIRFLDLQKAEAQAQEAQIETALEKVRSRTMAMQKGEELQEVAVLLYKELIGLGVTNFVTCGYVEVNEAIQRQHTWVTSPGGDTMGLFHLPLTGDATFDARYAAWKKQQTVFHQSVAGQIRRDHLEYAITTFNSKEAEEMVRSQFPDPTVFYCFNFSHGYLHLVGGSLLEKEEEVLLARFTKVFEQTYTRFLDLQKAEAQAREAKIETALEKVRSRTMGMQSSDELPEVANLLFTEVRALGINAWSCGYNILSEDKKTATCCMSSEGTLQTPFQLRLWGEASFVEMGDFIQSDENMLVQELSDKAIEEHYAYMKSFPDLKPTFDEIDRLGLSLPTYQINHLCKFNQGFILFITYEKVPDAHDIFKRFTKVFNQTYTRFLDLQKAEAQAKEAKIEAALEKVRSVALSLKNSDDMLDIAKVLYEQLLELGFTEIRNAIIDIHNDANETFLDYDYSHDMSSAVTEFSFYGDPVIEQQIKKVQSSNDAFFEIELKGKDLEELIKTRLKNGEKDDPRLYKTDYLTYNLYSFGNGAIGISNFGILSDTQKKVLKRFRNVFTFAYKRYTDLANAEAQAMEAKIETSLEKVRSVALGLNKSDDMLEVAQALYEQLLSLGFTNIRNSIIDIDNGDGLTFSDFDYSHEMGGTITQMSYNDDPALKEQLEDILATTDGFSELVLEGQKLQDLINMRRNNGEKDDPRLRHASKVSYILYAFGKGAIGISNFGVLPEHQKSILSRFRNVFTFAYQRYTDLAQSEAQAAALLAEKQRLEVTLADLQATQSQLIQSEKMASLGELTAGIAHEIQNPLNFVNNFSEVSNELIDEILEERAKNKENRNEDLVDEILGDIKQNLEKINHHGKRADGIVKGMLQHSRAGGDKKEPTDINVLADEYLRLAYHGLRAKDKSFNAELVTNFDKSLQKINVVPQDIGRVILNLLTNAFYAVHQKKQTGSDDFKPIVSISTKQFQNEVNIIVSDNGNGIPEHIKDKIFQPFFTTKPSGQGTGLGLSMSFDIIKAHGGMIKIQSNEGEGTTFIINLPREIK